MAPTTCHISLAGDAYLAARRANWVGRIFLEGVASVRDHLSLIEPTPRTHTDSQPAGKLASHARRVVNVGCWHATGPRRAQCPPHPQVRRQPGATGSNR